jgi:hypothetical protein
MNRNRSFRKFKALLLFASGLVSFLPGASYAQESASEQPDSPRADSPKPDSPKPDTPTAVALPNVGEQKKTEPKNEHRFWDKENAWLFAGVGATRTLDYFSTLNMRRRGRQEILLTDDVVDNHAAFAAIEASATGVSIGAAYLFHRYEHHKLERWTSIVHIGVATVGSVRNYCLKTAHFAATPSSP